MLETFFFYTPIQVVSALAFLWAGHTDQLGMLVLPHVLPAAHRLVRLVWVGKLL
jgi:hypothetical protein